MEKINFSKLRYSIFHIKIILGTFLFNICIYTLESVQSVIMALSVTLKSQCIHWPRNTRAI